MLTLEEIIHSMVTGQLSDKEFTKLLREYYTELGVTDPDFQAQNTRTALIAPSDDVIQSYLLKRRPGQPATQSDINLIRTQIDNRQFPQSTGLPPGAPGLLGSMIIDALPGLGPPPGSPPGFNVGDQGPPLQFPELQADLVRRGGLFKEQEGQPRNIFEQFIATSPQFSDINTAVRSNLERQFNPAFQSFLLEARPEETFRNFLSGFTPGGGARAGGAGSILDPTQGAARIAEIGSMFGAGDIESSPMGKLLKERFSSGIGNLSGNEAAFDAALQTFLPGVNPLFRSAVTNQAQNVFDQFQGTTPDLNFIEELGRRGGNIFGAQGSSGNPFMAFR